MWISTRALLVAMVLCVVMCLPHFEEMGFKVETGILILLGACILGLCKPRKMDGELLAAVLGAFILGVWLSSDFNPLGHSLLVFLLPLCGSWLAGEFHVDALPARNDRIFVLIKYGVISVFGLWSVCSGFSWLDPILFHETSARWFGKGDAPLVMLWLLMFLSVFWALFGLRLVVLKLRDWLGAGK